MKTAEEYLKRPSEPPAPKSRSTGLRSSLDRETHSSRIPPMVDQVLRSPGQSLDSSTRAFMEHRMGHNFGDIRVHNDEEAAESARSIHAVAYTSGYDVVFGRGSYSTSTAPGRRLLAHELAHVGQSV